jgi:spermidine synthase
MLRAAAILIGFTAVIAQIVLLRELMVVCSGNEISLGLMLANWLLWTALGSALAGPLAARTGRPRALLAGLECLLAAAFPLAVFAVRSARGVLGYLPGEILGPAPMFLISFVTLSLFCFLSGGLFPVAARLLAAGEVYLLEAVGSGAGGLLAGLALILYLTPFQIAALVAVLNVLAAAGLTRRVAVLALLVFPFALPRLETLSLARLWRGFDLAAVRNSVYGNLAVVRTEGGASLYENGLVIFNVPDRAAAEEAVHYALFEHPAPRSLLLIGGGVNGSAIEALQHPGLESVDYVELDPAIFDVARVHFPREWAALAGDARVRVHQSDGRLFLKTAARRFDVIVVNLPDPETAQLNRFYTVEFFREAAGSLTAGGVLALQLQASENYISPALADFLRCIHKTLREVFPEVAAIPGETVHFFAATAPGTLVPDAGGLLARLRARQLRTRYVREYYLPFRMAPDRMRDLEEQIRPQPATPVNRDFAPVAYYFDMALWSTRFRGHSGSLWRALAGGAAAILTVLAIRAWRARRMQAGVGFCVAAMGFTLIGLEMLLLLGFQAIYGYVYHQLAILIAAFMAGIALGSWRAVRHPPARALRAVLLTQAAAAVAPLALYLVFEALPPLTISGQVVFPALALACGALGGYQFPIASRLFGSPGTLYALDLAGSCAGAILFSAWLVPLFGFLKTAGLMAAVNLAPAALAASGARRTPAP